MPATSPPGSHNGLAATPGAVALLLAGFTDARIAKQLDLGTRTVQRRIQGLMHLAQVKTRLQLGWHAYDLGWLTRR